MAGQGSCSLSLSLSRPVVVLFRWVGVGWGTTIMAGCRAEPDTTHRSTTTRPKRGRESSSSAAAVTTNGIGMRIVLSHSPH